MKTKEADLVFTSLTHFNKKKKKNYGINRQEYKKINIKNSLDFKGFLKSLEILIYKIYPELTVGKSFESFFFLKISKNLLQIQEEDPKMAT